MAIIDPTKKTGSAGIRGKIGIGWECGEIICGEAICGNEEHEVPAGKGLEGKRWGIYKKVKK